MHQMIIKFTRKSKDPRISKAFITKKTEFILSDIKSCYKAIVIKTMQYWWRDRTENSARNNTPSTDFDKRAKQVKGETMAFQ